ncbi:MAG TPA: acyl carrier protein [Candidatus Latescibacteria bacterium]|nr:acyl carrier protein [Candidatus Handelsmanbacteria bacterium]HIL12027.1 acyl carrier protein [Candidatus Latescibacterota bacterium]
MDKTEHVATRVKTLLVQVLQVDIDPEDIADDEPLFGDGLDADSMVALELVSAIEEAFGIEVTDDELRVELFESLRGLVEYVEGKTLSASC